MTRSRDNADHYSGATGGIANTNHLVANANIVDNDFLRVDGTSIEGRTAAETLSDIGFSDGHIIQTIVGTADSTSQTHGTGSPIAGATWELKTAPTVVITPTSDDNKILLLGTMLGDNSSDMIFIDLYRSGSGVTDSTLATTGGLSGETAGFGYNYNAGGRGILMFPIAWVDDPSWTSGAITYQYMFRASGDVGVVIGQASTATMLIAMEIKG